MTLSSCLKAPSATIRANASSSWSITTNKAEYRTVQLGPQVDGKRVVLSGIKAGDRVILDHLQRLAPGAQVAPQPDRTASN